ncbi:MULTISPECIES: DUF3429 domain-containing protein [unclassified Shewanella]|uniref:DUF3429 domain-containing protein n=1 Tax=unclassified Shewanella TaxID=196818 RepID=UPI001BBCF0B4|nr:MULTISPECIES: DUF3429 domain-containing protein [unclassified Shewanella]GIU14981.1 hypothetical protein TUM4444_25520 [Shewanella sp. MBTL60-112-B1]GIU39064.1 hypothetical protein TUM4445_34490 [Shewanella sp. MBTL60-112-B2]
MIINQQVWRSLGYAGLLPFIIAAIMSLAGWSLPWFNPEFAFVSYSAIILSFLAGTLWGRALFLYAANLANLLILSNLYALLAWLALMLQQTMVALVILAFGYFSLLGVEKNFQNLPVNDEYQQMRTVLTSIALLTHFLMFIALVIGG